VGRVHAWPGAEATYTLKANLFSAPTTCVCMTPNMNLNRGRYPNKWRLGPLSCKKRRDTYSGDARLVQMAYKALCRMLSTLHKRP
jgi:hypothetical protein